MTIAFFTVVGITLVLILVQIGMADRADKLRQMPDIWFHIRRGVMILKALSLCWMVIYSHDHGWEPWTPIMAFMAAFDAHLIVSIVILQRDIFRMKGRVPSGTIS